MAIKSSKVEEEVPEIKSEDTAVKHKFGKKSPFSFKRWDYRDKNYSYRYINLDDAERRTDEGFEIVSKDEVTKIKPVAGKANASGAWELRGTILMRCLSSVCKERDKYYQNMWKTQISGDKQRLQEEADKNDVELIDNR